MDIWKKHKSPLGYETNNGGIDSYGVDHSGFSVRDEVEYQTARNNRENQIIDYYNNQGITENYPQYTTNFWGSPDNNYGFGSSNISQNIDSVINSLNNQGFSYNGSSIQADNLLQQGSSGISQLPTNSVLQNSLHISLQPPSYLNDNQAFTTDYTDNYPVASDAMNYNRMNPTYLYPQTNISDEDLYARMWENIKQHENVISHPYLDTKGLITIGGGANVNDWNVFKNLNVTVEGVPATEAQKLDAYNRLRQLSDEKDVNGNYVNRNMQANFFENKTNIRISDAEARGLAQNHMTNDLTHLRNEFSDFDNFPLPLKEVLLDIQYNVKGGVNPNDWPNLYSAIRNRDIDGIIDNVNRPDVGKKRNDWAKKMVRSIRF